MKANRKFKELHVDEGALMFNMLVGAGLAVILLFAILNIGTYINGTISSQLVESYGTATSRTTLENSTVSTLENITAGYDRTVEIIVVAAIITAITIPLAAIVAVKKLLG